jgi:hypothetical protein
MVRGAVSWQRLEQALSTYARTATRLEGLRKNLKGDPSLAAFSFPRGGGLFCLVGRALDA